MKSDDMIFDVGVHKGEDSAFYLAKGFRVIGFEADPQLAKVIRQRFQSEIRSGRFQLVEGAITDATGEVTFYKNASSTQFGTLYPKWRHRNEQMGHEQEAVSVTTVNFADALAQYGVPHYMKIDIEGADHLCLDALMACEVAPDYLSLESDKTDLIAIKAEISALQSLGYVRFKAVQQRFIHRKKAQVKALSNETITYGFERGASGPFGSDLAGHWISADELTERYMRIFENYRRWGDETVWKRNRVMKLGLDAAEILSGIALPGWYDTHAAL